MNHHFVRFASAVLMLVLINQSGFARVDSLQVTEPPIHTPRFRSIQADYVTAIFINAVSLSADFDLSQPRMSKPMTFLGVRAGIERIQAFTFEGEVNGSPFVDYNVLARLTSSAPASRMDVYAGFAYRTGSGHPFHIPFTPGGSFKIGFDLKWMLIDKLFGLMLKFNVVRGGNDQTGSGGIGFVLAWDQ
jgi:hypothetical protein